MWDNPRLLNTAANALIGGAAKVEMGGAGAGGIFSAAALAAVRARLEQVSWVRHVDVRRVWPDRIEVKLEEHVAFARWGDTGLVNTFGEPFTASMDGAGEGRVPLFAGPAGTGGGLSRRSRRFS